MIVIHHCKLVDPHDSSKSLNPRCLLIANKVPYKEAFAFALDEAVMAFGTTSGRATRRTKRTSPNPWDFVAARAI